MTKKFHDMLLSIEKKKTKVGIVGIGYVGSTLGEHAAETGFRVKGYDITPEAIKRINKLHIRNFQAIGDIRAVMKSEIICICVPTPVTEEKVPDLTLLENAAYAVASYLKKGQLVIVESTIAPGTTRNRILPILEGSGLRVEKDFFLAFSPERVDPGNTTHTFRQIPKVVGGVGPLSSLFAKAFYSQLVDSVSVVSSPEAAEMAKMLENTFRLVNISLINELSEYTKAAGIDILEVVQAASTKPFGFMPHLPGPGIGGHCIPVDPYYVLHDAKDRFSLSLGLLHAALITNEIQPLKVVKEALRLVKQHNGIKRVHKVLLIGVSYKPNIADTRETPALTITQELEMRDVDVSFYDPYVKTFLGKKSIALSVENIDSYDLIIMVTPHKGIDYQTIVTVGVPILDACNVFSTYKASHIYNFFVKTPKTSSSREKRISQQYYLYE